MKKKQVMNRSILYGFTLIELMITVAIVGILAAEMMDIANRQEQFLLTDRSYASKTTLEASGYTLPSDVSSKYSYAVVTGTGTVPSYTLTFTPTGTQASDGDLVITSEGVKTPADKW